MKKWKIQAQKKNEQLKKWIDLKFKGLNSKNTFEGLTFKAEKQKCSTWLLQKRRLKKECKGIKLKQNTWLLKKKTPTIVKEPNIKIST